MQKIKLLVGILFLCDLLFGQSNINKDTLKFQMAPITVTATRYAENTIEIPYAVTILPKEQLTTNKGYGFSYNIL